MLTARFCQSSVIQRFCLATLLSLGVSCTEPPALTSPSATRDGVWRMSIGRPTVSAVPKGMKFPIASTAQARELLSRGSLAGLLNPELSASVSPQTENLIAGNSLESPTLIWFASDGSSTLWQMTGTVWNGGGATVLLIPPPWRLATAMDLNGDDNPDLIWESTTDGTRAVTFMNGGAYGGSYAMVFVIPPEWKILTGVDFDADAKNDLVLTNTLTGDNGVLYLNGTAWTGVFTPLPNFGLSSKLVGVGAMNGDHKPDLVTQNIDTGQPSVYFLDGTSVDSSASIAISPGAEWSIAAVADFDLNGKNDLVFQNDSSGLRSIWLMNSTARTGEVAFTSVAPEYRIVAAPIIHWAPVQFTQQGAKLVGSGAVGTAEQGRPVAISADGNTAIVGARADDFSFADGAASVGAAWIWTRSGGVWTQQGSKLIGSGTVGRAWQGASVAISADGNTALVGGWNDNNRVGAVWVFTRNGSIWTQQGPKLVGTGAVGMSHQGVSVAVSADGNTAVVGGTGDASDPNDLFHIGVGAVWVFTRSGGVWAQQGPKLVASDAVGNSMQGTSVSISADGSNLIVGGPPDNNATGAAWVWTRTGGTWSQQGTKLVGSGVSGFFAEQGGAVSMSADASTVIVGGSSDNGGVGAAWVWTRVAGTWVQQGQKLVGSGAVGNAVQGLSVSISANGNTAIIGGPSDNTTPGAAWLWRRSGGVWVQWGNKIIGSAAIGTQVLQGVSVSLSADGKTAIIGGPGDAGNKGAAWIFIAPDGTSP